MKSLARILEDDPSLLKPPLLDPTGEEIKDRGQYDKIGGLASLFNAPIPSKEVIRPPVSCAKELRNCSRCKRLRPKTYGICKIRRRKHGCG